MHRKEFIRTTALGCLACLGVSILFEGCVAVSYVDVVKDDEKLRIRKSDLLTDEGSLKKVVVTKSTVEGYPVAVYSLGENQYSAVLLRCTHQGSELSVHGDILSCPSHGSEFSKTGEVLQGPAEMNLTSYKVTEDNENIYIHFK